MACMAVYLPGASIAHCNRHDPSDGAGDMSEDFHHNARSFVNISAVYPQASFEMATEIHRVGLSLVHSVDGKAGGRAPVAK
jgi:hypothetical protein